MTRIVYKVGLAALARDRLLLVRKRGLSTWILPGGKPEPGDADSLDTLRREVREELGVELLGSPEPLGRFVGPVAGDPDAEIRLEVFAAPLASRPRPRAEIEALLWVPLHRVPLEDVPETVRSGLVPRLEAAAQAGAVLPQTEESLAESIGADPGRVAEALGAAIRSAYAELGEEVDPSSDLDPGSRLISERGTQPDQPPLTPPSLVDLVARRLPYVLLTAAALAALYRILRDVLLQAHNAGN